MILLLLFLQQTPMEKDNAGWVIAPELVLVKGTCTGCHSEKLVLQNRGNRETWQEVIRTMQRDHGLWKLTPEVEEQVLNYLATHLPPRRKGRRANLKLPTHWLEEKPEKK